ncbi:MAG: glycosyltransferase [Flavobacterium sp.]|nr:MAG: glycosyltransferase [Flavobacterium sp.]
MHSLSIITINYNDHYGLEKTIASVFNQTDIEFEFIIIDGGSNDGSKELIEQHASKFTYWVSEPDAGIYNAMNKGIKVASGEFLLFLNSGDTLYQFNTLANAKSLINGYADIYYGDIISNNIRRTFPKQLTFSFFLEHSISHQASFIKRSLFDNLFYYNEDHSIISDWEFFIYAICKENVPTQHLDLIIADYDIKGLSSELKNHPKMHEERNFVINKYFPAFAKDYSHIKFLESKRGKQILHIKNNSFSWKILKAVMSLLIAFLPKDKT